MQQPNYPQTPAGWPGIPGLQSPLPAQASQFPPAQASQLPPPQASPQSPYAFPFPTQGPASQVPLQGYPAQPYGAQAFQPSGKQPQQMPPFQVQQQYLPGTQTQAAPVPPVSFPASPYGAQQQPGPQAAPQSQAQVLARQLIEVARTLEQLFPGLQILQSVLAELSTAPSGQAVTGLDESLRLVKDLAHCHQATLGSLRRLLMGETSPSLLTALATSFHSLTRLHPQLRPVLERITMAAPVPLRSTLTQLGQPIAAAEGLLGQVSTAIQALVGPQVWETAGTRQVRES